MQAAIIAASRRPAATGLRRALTTSASPAASTAVPEEMVGTFVFQGDVTECTSAPREQALKHYLKMGPLVLREEVPRQFEKYEWSTDMQRMNPISAEKRRQLKEVAPMRGGRFDAKPIVEVEDRHILIREAGLNLCEDLKNAAENKTSFARILTGARGVGKSATLLHALAYARASGWLTLYMPRAADLGSYYGVLLSGTGGPITLLPDSTVGKGLFQQPNAAKKILETTAKIHGDVLQYFPQRREYNHDLYNAKGGQKATLAHILMRGLAQPHRAADALYDLRMEFSLVEEVPVLIAVDEFNALYWPTAHYFQSKSVKSHELVLAKAFRFVRSVPGDIEDDPNPRTPRNPELNRMHLPKCGAIIGAPTRSIEALAHKEQIPPARFEEFDIASVEKTEIPRYSAEEIDQVLAWYTARKVCGPQSLDHIGKCRVYTQGIPEKVAQYAVGKLNTVSDA